MRYAAQENKHGFFVSKDEMKYFIGFLIFSGYHPSEHDYWSDDDVLGQPIVKNAMSKNAYLEIKSVIHVQDNTKAHENKAVKSFKTRPLLDKIIANLKKIVFSRKTFLKMGCAIVRYYGHHTLKQFIKGKPILFGYKLWALCGKDGYCYSFSLHAGKETEAQ
ncbi:hypothetical protein JTB14_000143 [Gonioctena quinquepunctata]|nr:hypothetical protein JTB14_000143 [Gonioctena quinquepunctata]